MKKHGNAKYKFDKLINVGDVITEYPNNVYSLKSAFRAFNIKRQKEGKENMVVIFNEYGGKRVDVELHALTVPKTIDPVTK